MTKVKSILISFLFPVLFLKLMFALPALSSSTAETHEEWAGFLHDQMVQFMEQNRIPNAVAALVSSEDVFLLEGYGYADREAQVPVDPEVHLFRTGSVAKIFTWVALMQLHEEGRLDLGEDIRTYLDPELTFPKKYRSGDEPITFLHLLSHTAGFEDVLDDLFTFDPQPPLSEYIHRHQPARIFPPGSVMAYSNYGAALAGYIVERISGEPFEEYVARHIFTPLGMDHATMEQPPPADLAEKLVTPYRWVDDRFLPGRFEHMPAPAGGLSTTAADMARFLQANLRGGRLDQGEIQGTFLQEKTLAQMYSPLFTHHPLLGGMAHGFKEFTANGRHIIFHGGSTTVFDSGFYLIPGLDLGIFIAYSGGNYSGHKQLLRSLLDRFFPMDEATEALHALQDTLSPVPDAPPIGEVSGEFFQSRKIVTGPDRILNLIMGTVFVTNVDDSHFSATMLGEEFVYEEWVPGIYRNTRRTDMYPFGPLRFLVAGHAPDGRLMLTTDGPMAYIRAPWYGGTVMAMAVMLPMLLLAAGSLLGLLAALVVRMVRKLRHHESFSFTGKTDGYGILSAHAGTLLVMVFLVMLYGNPHPVHLLPESTFTGRSWMDVLLDILPFAVALLGLAVSWKAVVAWKRRDRGLAFRIHHTVYAAWSLALIWFFCYWGMLGL
ncbi:MAG: serine hydrolase domain-containing protein [Cyclonatronaceae bacterium]